MSDFKEIWGVLSKINVNEKTNKKGNLTYLSWSWAWETLMEHYPQAEYSYSQPTIFDNGTCEIEVMVTIDGCSRTMWLAVMDFKNKAVPNPSATEIANTRMRCLVKCLAMFGLGHYIYAGEDLPQAEPEALYSTEQHGEFMRFFNATNAYSFYLFIKHIGSDTYVNLYNSFDKDKVKNKEKCAKLEKDGLSQVLAVVDSTTQALNEGDPAWAEELEGLEGYQKAALFSHFSDETKAKMKEAK